MCQVWENHLVGDQSINYWILCLFYRRSVCYGFSYEEARLGIIWFQVSLVADILLYLVNNEWVGSKNFAEYEIRSWFTLIDNFNRQADLMNSLSQDFTNDYSDNDNSNNNNNNNNLDNNAALFTLNTKTHLRRNVRLNDQSMPLTLHESRWKAFRHETFQWNW